MSYVRIKQANGSTKLVRYSEFGPVRLKDRVKYSALTAVLAKLDDTFSKAELLAAMNSHGLIINDSRPQNSGSTPTPTPTPTPTSSLILFGTLSQDIAASNVTIGNAPATGAITLNIAGLTASDSGNVRTVAGTPATGSAYTKLNATIGGQTTFLDVIAGAPLATTGVTTAIPASPVGPLVIPTGFRMNPIVTVTRNANGTYSHNYNHDAYKPAATVTLYCGGKGNGDDTKDGLSWANRVESAHRIMELINATSSDTVVAVKMRAGRYRWSDTSAAGKRMSFEGTRIRRSFSIEAVDSAGNATTSENIILLQDLPHQSGDWVSMGDGVYRLQWVPAPDTIGGTQLPNGNVMDEKFPHPTMGRFTAMSVLHSNMVSATGSPQTPPFLDDPVGAVKWAAAKYGNGASYKDTANGYLYVKTKDGRVPDAQVLVSLTSDPSGGGRGLYVLGDAGQMITAWFRNVDFWGGIGGRFEGSHANGAKTNVFMEDCFSGGTRFGNGFLVTWGTLVFSRHKSYGHRGDSFGCNPPADVTVEMEDAGTITDYTNYYELDCIGDQAGEVRQVSTSTNGSSTHYNCNVMTVNSIYRNVTDRFMHYIKTSHVWAIHPTIDKHYGLSGDSNIGITSGQGPGNLGLQSTKVWVESPVISSDIQVPFEVTDNSLGGGGGTLYLRGIAAGLKYAVTSGGTLTTWTDPVSTIYAYDAASQGAGPWTTTLGSGVTIVSGKARLTRDAANEQRSSLLNITGYPPSSVVAMVAPGLALSNAASGGQLLLTTSQTGVVTGYQRGSTTYAKMLAAGGMTLVETPASGALAILAQLPSGQAGDTVDMSGVQLRSATLTEFAARTPAQIVANWNIIQGAAPTVENNKATLTYNGSQRGYVDISGLTVGQLYAFEAQGPSGIASTQFVNPPDQTGTGFALTSENMLDGSSPVRRYLCFIATATTHRWIWSVSSGVNGEKSQVDGLKLYTVAIS